MPDSEFIITTDDLERRRFFINLRHEEYNNQKVAKVSFVTQAWAEQQNPSIAGITFAHEAPRPVDLKPASSPSPPPQQEPLPEASGTAQAPKPSPQPPAATAKPNPKEAPETLSDEEFAEAIEYAKKLKQQKEGK